MIRYSVIPQTHIALLTLSLLTACGGSEPSAPSAPPQPQQENIETASSESAASVPETADRAADTAAAAPVDSSKWWSALPRAAWADFRKIDTLNPWFEVYEIVDGVFAIYEPGQFEEVISYLIVGRRGALLFDTGLGMGDIQSVVKQLTSQRIQVLNSHAHYDHVGGNYQFDNIIGRKHPFALSRSKGAPNSERVQFVSGELVWKTLPPDFVLSDYQTRPWEYSRWLRPGDFIDLGGVSLELITAPGHSPDSIALLDSARRLLFTGDTFYLGPLYAHLEGSSFGDYMETAAKLAALAGDVDYLLMSHNTPLAESRYLLDLDAAFQAIALERAPFALTDEGREYQFQGFSILTADPPEDIAPIIDAL